MPYWSVSFQSWTWIQFSWTDPIRPIECSDPTRPDPKLTWNSEPDQTLPTLSELDVGMVGLGPEFHVNIPTGILGRVGSGWVTSLLWVGSGWIGSKKLDPRPTLKGLTGLGRVQSFMSIARLSVVDYSSPWWAPHVTMRQKERPSKQNKRNK